MKKEKAGSGLTERETVWHGPDDGPQPEGALSNPQCVIHQLREHCVDVLRHHGLPDTLRDVEWLGKNTWREPAEPREGRVMSVAQAAERDEYIISDSPAGFAARALQQLQIAEETLIRLGSLARVDGGAFVATQRLFDSAFNLGMLLGDADIKRLEGDVFKGRSYSESQSNKALLRWGNREDIEGIIQSLAVKKDALGDPIPNKDLWSEFFAALDENSLNPVDTAGRREPRDDDRMTWKGNTDGMKFKTFRNRLSSARKPTQK